MYLARLETAPADAVASIALAEIADRRDAELFAQLLVAQLLADPRARVRAAALRALARVDRLAGRRAAIDAGASGRVRRAVAQALRRGAPSRAEAAALERIALDDSRPFEHRLSALSMLAPVRWLRLAVLLEVQERATDPAVRTRLRAEIAGWSAARAPRQPVRARIERLLPTLDADARRWIEFVLRTSR